MTSPRDRGVCAPARDLRREVEALEVGDASVQRAIGSRLDGGLVGEGAQHIEVSADDRHIGLLGGARELEHLRLALVAEVGRVGACLLEDRR